MGVKRRILIIRARLSQKQLSHRPQSLAGLVNTVRGSRPSSGSFCQRVYDFWVGTGVPVPAVCAPAGSRASNRVEVFVELDLSTVNFVLQ